MVGTTATYVDLLQNLAGSAVCLVPFRPLPADLTSFCLSLRVQWCYVGAGMRAKTNLLFLIGSALVLNWLPSVRADEEDKNKHVTFASDCLCKEDDGSLCAGKYEWKAK